MTPVGDEPMLAVFVPGLMGVGILVSGGILLVDGIRKLTPRRGARRRVLVARGIRGVVAGVARAVGLEVVDDDLLRRHLRSRWAYLAVGLALVGVSSVIARAGIASFTGEGTLHGNPWSIGLGLGFGIPFLLAGGLVLTIGVWYLRAPASLLRLVGRTWLGRLRPPPEDPRERALNLIPAPPARPSRGIEGGEVS